MLCNIGMTKENKIWHKGIVHSIDGIYVRVSILNHTACAGCHAKGMCGISEAKVKIIDADRPDFEVKPGDEVIVYASSGDASFSVVIAYVIPTFLLIISIALAVKGEIGEIGAAFLGLAVTALYFFSLYLFRSRIGRKIRFTIEKE